MTARLTLIRLRRARLRRAWLRWARLRRAWLRRARRARARKAREQRPAAARATRRRQRQAPRWPAAEPPSGSLRDRAAAAAVPDPGFAVAPAPGSQANFPGKQLFGAAPCPCPCAVRIFRPVCPRLYLDILFPYSLSTRRSRLRLVCDGIAVLACPSRGARVVRFGRPASRPVLSMADTETIPPQAFSMISVPGQA